MFAVMDLQSPNARIDQLDTRGCAVLLPTGSCRGDTVENWGLLSHPPPAPSPVCRLALLGSQIPLLVTWSQRMLPGPGGNGSSGAMKT